ncbi:hypothetical protein ACFFSH_07955 [Streptomyces filamentosus]|uniref:Uncharacterized protein n=1 Tax=Streptomyces filamentosus TaxID=67294 RepID=A0A919BKL3_STRFL|nr:hypothetical protein [Streptomyces filamentosus]GHF97050.1 hypothetical protein GCM10017667_29220 [Streptomyces filamentosus]
MSRCGARRSVYAVAEAVRPVWGGSVCVLDVGHGGLHRDRAGDGWWVTPEIADAVSASLAARVLAVEPEPEPEFRSPRCIVGRHDRCRDHAPRDSGVPGVRYLVCGCPCHPAAGA